MHKLVTSAHVLCWIVVGSFVVASVAYGFYMQRVSRDLWCGNALTDPLSFLLSYAAPAAGCAVVSLGALSVRGALRVWSPVSAGALSVVTLGALLAYGFWLFSTMLPGHPLSEIVWWMRPVWSAF
jgi:hypothetical protein